MTLDDALSMEPIKEKLKTLNKYIPNQEDIIYIFGAYLADRLNEELVPQGFYLAAKMVIDDLKRGKSEFLGKSIPSKLVGYPSQIYTILSMEIPRIAEAVCPPEFAEGVKRMDEAVNKR